MSELRLDRRVAVVTDAARGLGRTYALLPASRGGKIVVNDTGGSLGGDGVDVGPAEALVREILAAGGEAIVCTESAATPEGGQAIIDAALKIRYSSEPITLPVVPSGFNDHLKYGFEMARRGAGAETAAKAGDGR